MSMCQWQRTGFTPNQRQLNWLASGTDYETVRIVCTIGACIVTHSTSEAAGANPGSFTRVTACVLGSIGRSAWSVMAQGMVLSCTRLLLYQKNYGQSQGWCGSK